MKAVILLGLFILALNKPWISRKELEMIKKVSPFEVADYDDLVFKDWTDEEIQSMLSYKSDALKAAKIHEEVNIDIKNRYYDFHASHRECTLYMKNQQSCGSCWAFATTSVLEKRYCYRTTGRMNVPLSPQYTVSCDPYNQACRGGNPASAFRFLAERGTVTYDCVPYTAGYGYVEPCMDRCKNGQQMIFYRGQGDYVIAGVEQIMNEIEQNGPVFVGIVCYSDFMAYRGGIYRHTSGQYRGMHAVLAYGFGSQGGINYWIGQNSWGQNWGESGTFRMAFGECGIESDVHGTHPVV